MGSLGFFIQLISPGYLFGWGEGGRSVELKTLPPSCADYLHILDASISRSPTGPVRACNGVSGGGLVTLEEIKIWNRTTNKRCNCEVLRPYSSAFYDVMWKNILEPSGPHDSMAHAHFMLDTKGYKHTLRICNTHCFYTVTMVARTHLNDAFIRKLPVLLKLSAV